MGRRQRGPPRRRPERARRGRPRRRTPSPRLDLVTSLALETLIEETASHVHDWEARDPDHARSLRIALQGMQTFLQERGVPLVLPPKEEDGRT